MFAGDVDSAAKAKKIAEYLGDHKNFKSHGRSIKIPELLAQGVKVRDLRTMEPPGLSDAVTVLYCCFDLLLGNTGVFKIFENVDAAVVRQQQQMMIQIPQVNPPTNPQIPPMRRQ